MADLSTGAITFLLFHGACLSGLREPMAVPKGRKNAPGLGKRPGAFLHYCSRTLPPLTGGGNAPRVHLAARWRPV